MSDKTYPVLVTVNGNTCHTWIVSVNGRGYKQRKYADEDTAAAMIMMAIYIGRKWTG